MTDVISEIALKSALNVARLKIKYVKFFSEDLLGESLPFFLRPTRIFAYRILIFFITIWF